ncbi:putative neuferricin-like [Apostichopus japonicus]|uniref:Putative neuferricin-like n=1 Tax=Stichopus japonicus TaxID=307972 RepID=A0A2G8KI90_STIJA|nr:putative neuferricin-like [Apostichopus japonicus]
MEISIKLLLFSSLALGFAIVIAWYYPKEFQLASFSPLGSIFSLVSVIDFVSKKKAATAERANEQMKRSPTEGDRIFSSDELAAMTEDPILLGFLGKVFDVTKGSKHYGPGGGYQFFAGKDATRAFITGDFTESGLLSDINGLEPKEALEVKTWLDFYEKDYIYVGKLHGTYYDADGRPTEKLISAHRLIAEGEKEKAANDADKRKFPPCNSEWSEKTGTRIWCSTRSGGISRDWTGFPRKYFQPGAKSFRCACVPEQELDNPHFKMYDNCDPRATSCKLASKNE